MPAGPLRERVIFEKRSTESDGAGNFVDEWGSPVAVAARIRSLKGSEPVLAQRLAGTQPVVITIRASTATKVLTSDWRVKNARSGQTYNITAVTPDERGAYIDVLAVSGGADG